MTRLYWFKMTCSSTCLLYMLEREATDRGYFDQDGEVVRSVHMPDRVGVVVGKAT